MNNQNKRLPTNLWFSIILYNKSGKYVGVFRKELMKYHFYNERQYVIENNVGVNVQVEWPFVTNFRFGTWTVKVTI